MRLLPLVWLSCSGGRPPDPDAFIADVKAAACAKVEECGFADALCGELSARVDSYTRECTAPAISAEGAAGCLDQLHRVCCERSMEWVEVNYTGLIPWCDSEVGLACPSGTPG